MKARAAQKRLEKLFHERERLIERIRTSFESAFPAGERIVWNGKGPFPQRGCVLMAYGLTERVKVRNERTGKEYWIDYHWIDY